MSMVHPFSKETVKRSAEEPGSAAIKREQKKRLKYEKEMCLSQKKPSLAPLVFKHFGFWGPATEEYLDQLSRKSKDFENRNNEADFRPQLFISLFCVTSACSFGTLAGK